MRTSNNGRFAVAILAGLTSVTLAETPAVPTGGGAGGPAPLAPQTAGAPLLLVADKPQAMNLSPATAAGTTPLMGLLNGVGAGQSLKGANITVTGWVEGSWTYDASAPPGNILTGRAFDTKSESLQLDQVDLTFMRPNDYAKPFDVGFQIENNYGWDSAYLHANGMLFNTRSRTAEAHGEVPGAGTTADVHPKAQYDLTLANVVFSTGAVGKGLGVRVGKFPSILGAESLDAYSKDNQAPFFSRSFIFTQEPFTETGVLIEYSAADNFTVKGGLSRGWDQAISDNNGTPDFLGQVNWRANQKTAFTLGATTGNEEARGVQDGWRSVVDFVGAFQASDQLTLSVNGMYAWEAQAGNGGAGGGTGQWYAVAAYASYRQSDYFTFNLRGEWFDDQDGAAPRQFNAAAPMSALYNRAVGASNVYTEVTLGTTFHPLPNNAVFNNFALRPEVRFDYADHATWDAGTDRYRLTAAIEGFWAF